MDPAKTRSAIKKPTGKRFITFLPSDISFLLVIRSVYRPPGFRIPEVRVERHSNPNVAVLLGHRQLSVMIKNNFSRHPAAAFHPHIFVELRFLDHLLVPTAKLYQPDEKQVFFRNPKLRRVQVALLCTDNIRRLALPRVFVKNGRVQSETFELRDRDLDR